MYIELSEMIKSNLYPIIGQRLSSGRVCGDSAQFQSCQCHQGEYSGKDPETYHDLGFVPSFSFKVVMDRGTEEDPFPGKLK